MMNESLLAKLAWKVIQGSDFGFRMMQRRYLYVLRQPRFVRTTSSIWMGIRQSINSLLEDSFCSNGDGSTISFWWDDWLGYSIADRLAILPHLRRFLDQPVSKYFFDGFWHFTESFVDAHPSITCDILLLPLGDREDIRYWKPSTSGDVTAGLVFRQNSRSGITNKWGGWIWVTFLPVRRSIVSWRAIRGCLPTYDTLMRCGIRGPNICMICCRNTESIDHIFWNCPTTALAWKGFMAWFGKDISVCHDLNIFIVYAMDIKFSPQFSNIWRFGIVTMIWLIWMERNRCMFEEKQTSQQRILSFVKAVIQEVSSNFNLGASGNSWGYYERSRALGVSCSFAAPHAYVSVVWWPPLIDWVKVNTDGSASGSPGQIAAGGVFRDATGTVRGCFHRDGGPGFAMEAEILAAIVAIEIAYSCGWKKLWLETDSTYVAHLLESRSKAVPWRFANAWRAALDYVELMDFRVSHIYREGNQVADILANLSTPQGWWTYCILLIYDAVCRDMASPRFYREV